MTRPRRSAVLLFAPLLASSGCMVGPNYRAPTLPAPAAWAEAGSTSRTAMSTDQADLSAWWDQFRDPELSSLVRRALAQNLDVRAAQSRVRQARDVVVETAAREYPQLNASGNALTFNSNRGGASGATTATASASAGSGAAGGFALPGHLNLYSVGFDASWEIDIFGGVRRSVQEARANMEVASWAVRDAEVTLTAEVALDYLTLREAQTRLAVGQAELARQRSLFALIRARRQTGFVTNLDVNQQSTAVATAAAQLPQLEAETRTDIHAIGVLLGETPESLSAELTPAAAVPPPPPTLPLGLPSQLLQRRPDLREAERRLAAASADIGVQTANLYPRIDLLGLGSFASTSVGNLFDAANLSSAALGMITAPVFDAGRRRAAVRASKEVYDQAFIAYRSATLGAFRDVEDALSRYRSDETRRASLVDAVSAAQNSLQIAQAQYRTGFVAFINVLQSEVALLNARDQLSQADAQVVTDLVSLYKALGGGWTASRGDTR